MDALNCFVVLLGSSDQGVESMSDLGRFHVDSSSFHNSEELVDHGMRVGSSMSDN